MLTELLKAPLKYAKLCFGTACGPWDSIFLSMWSIEARHSADGTRPQTQKWRAQSMQPYQSQSSDFQSSQDSFDLPFSLLASIQNFAHWYIA